MFDDELIRVSDNVKQQYQMPGNNYKAQKRIDLMRIMSSLDKIVKEKKAFEANLKKQNAPLTDAQKKRLAKYNEIVNNNKNTLAIEKDREPVFYEEIAKEYKRAKEHKMVDLVIRDKRLRTSR